MNGRKIESQHCLCVMRSVSVLWNIVQEVKHMNWKLFISGRLFGIQCSLSRGLSLFASLYLDNEFNVCALRFNEWLGNGCNGIAIQIIWEGGQWESQVRGTGMELHVHAIDQSKYKTIWHEIAHLQLNVSGPHHIIIIVWNNDYSLSVIYWSEFGHKRNKRK